LFQNNFTLSTRLPFDSSFIISQKNANYTMMQSAIPFPSQDAWSQAMFAENRQLIEENSRLRLNIRQMESKQMEREIAHNRSIQQLHQQLKSMRLSVDMLQNQLTEAKRRLYETCKQLEQSKMQKKEMDCMQEQINKMTKFIDLHYSPETDPMKLLADHVASLDRSNQMRQKRVWSATDYRTRPYKKRQLPQVVTTNDAVEHISTIPVPINVDSNSNTPKA
jgi:septal ring factor EnvC (AmiA/AmiB activator)